MRSLQDDMLEFKQQLQKGSIQKAYQGIMAFMMGLKNHFAAAYPDYAAPGGLYFGYMDMTYFSILPKALKERELKIAIVFVYDSFRFEVWLSGKNKQVLAKYWQLFRQNQWDKYNLNEPGKGIDYIVTNVLVADPDFGELDALTQQVEQGTMQFIQDIEGFLLKIGE